jgi:hypothetical protein
VEARDTVEPSPIIFWNLFSEEKDELYTQIISGNVRPAYERIGEFATLANFPYVYEVTSDADNAILIFTPESDRDIAIVIDSFVAAAPALPRWKIFNRRQAKPVEDAFAMLENVYEVDVRDATFSMEQGSAGFDVVMYSKAADILGEEEKEGFVSFFLEHAIGEANAMAFVGRRAIHAHDRRGIALSPHDFVTRVLRLAKP